MTSVHTATARYPSRFVYNPALDGLRALAIAGVIAQHSGVPGVDGYHGVTLFFVISGYLISRLLLQEHAGNGRIGLRRFYGRRLARLGPALVVAVFVTWGWLAITDQPLSSYWAGIIGSLTYTTDIVQAVSGNDAVGSYFQWSWSLGVEELFYLIWPVSLLVLVKLRRFGWGAGVLVAAIAGCWVLRACLLANGVDHDRFYFAPDTNADALLLGTLLALVLVRRPDNRVVRIVGRVIGPLGLVALVALVWPHGADAFAQIDNGAFGQAGLASAALVLWIATTPRAWVARVFSWRPFVFIGKLSYGIYLWNLLTIFIFVDIVHAHPAASGWGILWLVALLGIAYASWRFVETPLRKRWAPVAPKPPPPPSLSAAPVAAPVAADADADERTLAPVA